MSGIFVVPIVKHVCMYIYIYIYNIIMVLSLFCVFCLSFMTCHHINTTMPLAKLVWNWQWPVHFAVSSSPPCHSKFILILLCTFHWHLLRLQTSTHSLVGLCWDTAWMGRYTPMSLRNIIAFLFPISMASSNAFHVVAWWCTLWSLQIIQPIDNLLPLIRLRTETFVVNIVSSQFQFNDWKGFCSCQF